MRGVAFSLMAMTWLIIFLLALLVYIHAGYPLLMAFLARIRPKALASQNPGEVGLSIVVCARNAGQAISTRLENLLACEWEGPLEIVVYCDGCEDDTAVRARALDDARVKVIEALQSRGKAAALNAAIPACSNAFVVLCDVRQTFVKETLKHLIRPLNDPRVMAVSGLLEIAPSKKGSGQGVDLYWRLECKIREWEGCYDSVIGCTGAIYAIRKDAFTPLNEDTILDDVEIPMRMAVAGGRICYEPRARAFDPQTLDPEKEKLRKLRTLVGNFQILTRYPHWLLPWKNRLWWQLISHKYLRLAVPWLLIALALSSVIVSEIPWVQALILAQAFCYACAIVGILKPSLKWRLFTIPAGFVLLQWSCLHSFFAFLRHRRDLRVLWKAAPNAKS